MLYNNSIAGDDSYMDINDHDNSGVVYGDKFTWNSQAMMPDVIATRAKVNIL